MVNKLELYPSQKRGVPYYTTRSSSLYLLLSKVVLDAQVARQMQKLHHIHPFADVQPPHRNYI